MHNTTISDMTDADWHWRWLTLRRLKRFQRLELIQWWQLKRVTEPQLGSTDSHSHPHPHTHTTGADSIIIANRMYRHTVTLTSSKLYAPCTVPDQMKWIGRARTAEETIFLLLNNEFVCTVGHFVHLYMDHVTSKFSNQRHVVVDPSGMSSLSWLAARTVVVWKYSSPATWGKCSHL